MQKRRETALPDGWHHCPICNELIAEGTVFGLASHLRIEEGWMTCPCLNLTVKAGYRDQNDVARPVENWIEHLLLLIAMGESFEAHLFMHMRGR